SSFFYYSCQHPDLHSFPTRRSSDLNVSPLTPVGSGFTYQGRLLDGGNPANGSYDFQILLYDAAVGGNEVGSIFTATNQLVSDGLDRKSTRLNSSHVAISYAVFCLKK